MTFPNYCLDAPELAIDVDPRVASPPPEPNGIEVSPIRVPAAWTDDVPPSAASSDPCTWDRSGVPAGACVFRIYGLDSTCYLGGGTFFVGPCDARGEGGPEIAPGSFYDTAWACSERPGCPSASANGDGYWWYFYQSGYIESEKVVFSDLVICAPECANSFATNGGCLRLHPSASRCE